MKYNYMVSILYMVADIGLYVTLLVSKSVGNV